MGYLIGAGPLDPAVKRYDGGTSSFTMDNSGTTNGTLLWVDGVAQVPGTDYNVSGTTITTTTAAAAGTNTVVSLQLFNTGLITTPADNTVAIAKIQDDAVTLAKMAAGTDGNLISYDTSGDPVAVATGSDGQVLTSSGAGAVCAFEDAGGVPTRLTEQATTSGTTKDFTIPTGAIRVTIQMIGVSTNSTTAFLIQLGDSGGVETSGYESVGSRGSSYETDQGAGFAWGSTISASGQYHGRAVLEVQNASNFIWTFDGRHGDTGNQDTIVQLGMGSHTLDSELTTVRLTTVGGNTFDAGLVDAFWE